MMRSKDRLAIAVRRPSGEIIVHCGPWFVLTRSKIAKAPLVRGFPVLMETMINGIKALNYSAQQALEEEEEELTTRALAMTLIVAVAIALGVFVGLPHFFSLGMKYLGLGGGVEALSFHLWDGLFRLILFLGYVLSISFLPDIRRVFQYHGAEHKVIHAYESSGEIDPLQAKEFSRLHPRCGTAFLLFVLSVSIILYAFLVPLVIMIYSPENFFLKHGYILGIKLLLTIPISGISYEMIKIAGKIKNNALCFALCAPGLLMQMITTKEPDDDQIEVAIAALKGALGEEHVCQA
ncbi:MAG: DUF1385 domain-containing protein [Desulfovibrionales bacterium]